MTSLEKGLREFAQFAAKLEGDEKSEAQTFLFHLLAAIGHDPNTLPEGSPLSYWVEVTREAAKDVANAFNSLVFRGEDRVRARRFILQCVVAMFVEDIGLLPQDLFTRLLDEYQRGASSSDLIGGLFRQMNDSNPARAGRYAGVDYFNGALFATVGPIKLAPPKLGSQGVSK
jgi:hypothetical protein